MGKYDIIDKNYFTQPAHFAELISNGIYRGKIKISEHDIKLLEKQYPSLAGSSGTLERDGICLCLSQGIKYGLEIENYSDYGMPRRIMVYDACEYEKEAAALRKNHEKKKDLVDFVSRKSGMAKEDGYLPVLDIVLYLGMGHFNGRVALRDCFRIAEKIKPYVFEKIQNYTFCVIEADYVNPKDYSTELKQFFQALQSRYDKRKLAALFEREDFQNLSLETQKMIVTHLDIKKLKKKVVEEDENMCKAYRDLVKDWKQEGRQEGRQEGLLFAVKSLMESMHLSAEQAMNLLQITEEERNKIII